jgi:hypothetical protein
MRCTMSRGGGPNPRAYGLSPRLFPLENKSQLILFLNPLHLGSCSTFYNFK